MRAAIRRSMCLLMLLLAGGGVAASHADVCEPFTVGIHLRIDPSIASRHITDRLKIETQAIWEPYGVRIEWTDADSADPPANGVSLDAIVERRFEQPERTNWLTVLGRAFVYPDAPNWQPIRVSLEATQRVLRMVRPSAGGLLRDDELGRALGRVLAHEIGHVLLAAPNHDRAGLMRVAFRPDELAWPNRAPFHLTGGRIDQLRSRLAALAGRASSGGAPCTNQAIGAR